MINSAETITTLIAACESAPGVPRSKDDPVYAEITEHRDVGAMRAHYSSCGDLGNWLLWAAGVPGANHADHYHVGRNISALAWHHLAATAGTAWVPSAGDIMLLWNLPSTADAHCAILLDTLESPPAELRTANYGAGGMSAAASPGACVSTKWLRKATGGQWYYGAKRVQHVIPWAAWSATATQQPQLPGGLKP